MLAAESAKSADWIWSAPHGKANEEAYFRTQFTLDKIPAKATLRVTCDNKATVILNGKKVASTAAWTEPFKGDVAANLVVGENWIAVKGTNEEAGAAGLVLEIIGDDRKALVSTDGTWKVSGEAKDWDQQQANISTWKPAVSIAKYGAQPWGKAFDPKSSAMPDVSTVTSLPGFKVELLYTVPKADQGSWVSLTTDDKGRLLAGDQDGFIYRTTLSPKGEASVEKLTTQITHAQGLLYANKSLYVVKNGPQAGLYRLRDTNYDDQFDEEKLLRLIEGSGEHGPHQVNLSPDGKSLYVNGGNHTKIPAPEKFVYPQNYAEDHLLPRDWDANGHAKGIMAPGGWIAQTDFDGNSWTLVTAGFRNEYDVAFSPAGEAFTYDSDMEWDIGMPWYRPTRICHAIPGGDFGWRSGTGKWPSYYLDSLPATVDIGPGSPTGVLFGTGAKFPAKYQHAFYALDWTYGTLYAIHLTPKGGSFAAEKENFITGKPLPLTDAIIHPQDGAMYFTVGGRKTQSALYRVTYTGAESTAPAAPLSVTKEAKVRHELEALHLAAPSKAAQDLAWSHLGDNDRFVRFAARILLEHQPVADWQQRALDEHENPNASLTALCALCRTGDKSLQPKILKALARVHDQGLREAEALDLFRVYSLCFTRMGKPSDPAVMAELRSRFEPMYPSPANIPNKELCELLVFLDSKQVVPKTMQLMVNAKDDTHQDSPGVELLAQNENYAKAFKSVSESRPNRQQITYAFALRNATEGWTPELRKQYFRWYNTSMKWKGGNSFAGFLKNMKAEAMVNVPAELREEMDKISGEMMTVKKELPRAEGPGQNYAIEDILKLAEGKLKGRNFERGHKMFQAGLCSTCHQFAGEGGGVGPDITGAGNRYSLKDLLENIIEPSKTISDQYESTLIEKADGSSLVGRITLEGDEKIKVVENPLDPDAVTEVVVNDIKARTKYPISAMPPALLNSMNQEEVLDLVAFLLSGGNPDDKVFK